ncbi:MAG: IS1/IS6 family transposase [Chloroflexi bacterium]|nr:IS1/IS6 family transposase [Chloroflexota bacterium]
MMTIQNVQQNQNPSHCPNCESDHIVKYGTYEGVQRYFCKVCKRKFVPNRALPKMKTPSNVVASALSGYFGGMPLDAIQRHLQQQYGVYMSEMGIYNWIVRFAGQAVKQAKEFKPVTGDTWVADETVIKVGGKNVWFFDVIDQDSRYLLASRIALSRNIKETALVMKEAQRVAGKSPKRILTDGMTAYPDGIEGVFGADTKHQLGTPFSVLSSGESTAIVERFHGTMKDRTNVIRGFKNMEHANLLTDAWLVHYNFFKEHESLGNIPPAQAMKTPVPLKDWVGVIQATNKAMVSAKACANVTENRPIRITPKMPRITPKFKRLPK